MQAANIAKWCAVFLLYSNLNAQQIEEDKNRAFSLGLRTTMSYFDSDGWGLGSGGHFRIQLNKRVNTEWFADYINIQKDELIRSEYAHIGWSVMYYLLPEKAPYRKAQPYVLAGHCFDFNRKSEIGNEANSAKRWGSAIQAGVGLHYRLSDRADFSLTAQYMIHLTSEIEARNQSTYVEITKVPGTTLEGHMLSTLSVNYKLFKW